MGKILPPPQRLEAVDIVSFAQLLGNPQLPTTNLNSALMFMSTTMPAYAFAYFTPVILRVSVSSIPSLFCCLIANLRPREWASVLESPTCYQHLQ
jgi:hypothetical protein